MKVEVCMRFELQISSRIFFFFSFFYLFHLVQSIIFVNIIYGRRRKQINYSLGSSTKKRTQENEYDVAN